MRNTILVYCLGLSLLVSCARRNFQYRSETDFHRAVEEQYGTEIEPLFKTNNILNNSRYFLGISLRDTFMAGELTFTQPADYTISDKIIQYCYILFDDYNNVFYNTYAVDNLFGDKLDIDIPYEVGLDTLSIDDAPDALQGKYYLLGDTIRMILESKEQDELVDIQAKMEGSNEESFKIIRVTRKRLTFSPLYSPKSNSSQKVFNTNQLFSIDLRFMKMKTNQKVFIRRDELVKQANRKG